MHAELKAICFVFNHEAHQKTRNRNRPLASAALGRTAMAGGSGTRAREHGAGSRGPGAGM